MEEKNLSYAYTSHWSHIHAQSGGHRFDSVTMIFCTFIANTPAVCCMWWRGLYWKVERLLACGTFTEFSKALNSALIFYGSISWWRRVEIKVEQLWKTHSIFHLIFIKRMTSKRRDEAALTVFAELQRRAHTHTHTYHYDEDVVDEHTAWITIRRGNERVGNEQRCGAKDRGTRRFDFIMFTDYATHGKQFHRCRWWRTKDARTIKIIEGFQPESKYVNFGEKSTWFSLLVAYACVCVLCSV